MSNNYVLTKVIYRKMVFFFNMLKNTFDGSLTRALAIELAPIRVNAVCSGTVRTNLLASMSETGREAFFSQVGSKLLTGKVGDPKDLAEAYLYLMRGSFTTGQIIVVDGGSLVV